jgi:DNA-binding transcriptional MerR regulator
LQVFAAITENRYDSGMYDSSLNLPELLKEANRLKDSIPELADTDEFTDRTVYYYAQQGLLPRSSRKRGPGTRYPEEFVDRLLFIRRLQKEQSLTLANIREVMENVSPQTIHNVGRGLEPLEIRISDSIGSADSGAHPEVLELNAPLNAMEDFSDKPALARRSTSTKEPRMSFSEPEFAGAASASASASEGSTGKTYRVGSDAELTVKKTMTPLQEKRVEQMVELLQSIIEEDG